MKNMKTILKGALALAMVALGITTEAGQAITFTATSASKVYDGTALAPAGCSITAGSLRTHKFIVSKTDVVDYDSASYSVDGVTDAGVHPYKVTSIKIKSAWNTDVTSDYDITYADGGTLTITPATITSLTLNEPTTLSYTGKDQTVTVGEVKAGNLTLSASDYDITGNTASEVGVHTVTVTGKGNYQGTATATWEIKAHTHKWSYATSTDGNVVTLTATCTEAGCLLDPPTTSATLTLSSGDKAYDGQAITATLDKGDFETLTGISLGAVECTGNATDVGTYTFSVSAEGTGCDFGKSVTISVLDISNATFELDNSSFDYTDEMRAVNVKTLTAGGVTVTGYEKSGVWSAQYVGTYEVTVTGTGNFCGSKSTTWTIKTPTKSITGAAAADAGYGTVTDNKLSVSDSTKLVWKGNNTWAAGITLTWPIDERHNSTWDFTQGWDYTDVAHVRTQLSTTDKVYTGTQIQAGETDGEDLTLATDTKTYKEKKLYDDKTCTYVKTTTWRAQFTLGQVTSAIAQGETHLTYQMTAFAPIWTGDDYLGNKYGVAPVTYTIEIPLDGIVLLDGDKNQVYPALNYVAQVVDTKKKYTTLAEAIGAATAGQTVNTLAACEKADFAVGANVTVNLAGFGASGATYKFVNVTDEAMGAKVVSTKAENVTTEVTGFAVQNDNYTYTLYRSHVHSWSFTLNGATLTASCTETGTECDLPGRATSITLTVTGGADGVAPAYSISNKDAFLASVNKFSGIVSIGDIKIERTTEDGVAYSNWYVGDYKATCVVTVAGEGEKVLEQAFSIAKPEGGYTKNGWVVGSSDIRYDSWEEAQARFADGDTVYYRGDDRDYDEHEFSVGDKNLTLDFGGKTLTKSAYATMTIKNTGSGVLTLQNVTLKQPRGWYIAGYWSGSISTSGNIIFGTGVVVNNTATGDDNYCKITASDGTLIVTNGQYECSFSGTSKLRGGQYKSKYGVPTADTAVGYIVRTISSGDYDRDIVYHEHHVSYSSKDNVISATCDAADHEYCGYGTKTATLNAPDKQDDGQAYALAEIVYSDGFPEQAGTITYWNGDQEISAPTTFGSYTAKTTIGGATAVKAFNVIHTHNFVYDKDDEAGTITARCTTTEGCDFNVNKRVATLNANNGTYTGIGQDLASVSKASDFPTEVELAYSCEGKPTNVGDYTATMTVADKSVTKNFSIAKASMSGVTLTLSGTSMDYTGGEQSVSIGSVKFGDYTLTKDVDYTVDESSVFTTAGSGASDTTSTIKIIGMGNFAEEAKTTSWTIKAPTRDFNSISQTLGGTLDGTTLTMAGADWTYYTAENAPDGSGIAGWYAGMRLKWPIDTLQYTRGHKALHTLSTYPGEQFWGDELASVNGLSAEFDSSISDDGCMKYTYWYTRLTPELAEACDDEYFVRTMTACGLTWSEKVVLVTYGDSDGVKEVTCTVTQPMADLVLKVPEAATYDLGATVLNKCSLNLAKDAKVTTTAEQNESKIFTTETGFQIYSGTEGGVTTYACWLATEYVTVPDVANATKVVKVGNEVKEPTEEGGNVYAVLYGDTVTITYTPNNGYETADGTKTIENVTGNVELTDLPTVTATTYAIAYELDGGENDPSNPTSYTIESETITLATPTKVGFVFVGWTPSDTISKGSTGDKAFTANWKRPLIYFIK